MSSLLLDGGRRWDLELIEEWFNVEDALAIRQTPLSQFGAPDMLIWHEDSLGQFSVRFAYLVARRVNVDAAFQANRPGYFGNGGSWCVVCHAEDGQYVLSAFHAELMAIQFGKLGR
ncbi:hypothetical protein COLO4_25871 [Corchorus olitorius]|uniref:Uncharacterized protein n=1 Tax=Corchorus olitorius TaxID=93759 RepID=A0A1R3HZN8_9ROSI|nr:hypothetical protein COLO4_25871 [Corchorus olitorius]